MNLATLIQQFSDEDKCRETLKELRWPTEVACPRCGSVSVSTITTRDQWDCNDCRYRFSVTSGTIFENTKLPLWKWFVAAYLIIESKKGISTAQVGRTLSVSYPTAWHLCHRIREAMDQDNDENRTLLSGIVEVDETRVGGHQERETLHRFIRRHATRSSYGLTGSSDSSGGFGPASVSGVDGVANALR